MKTEYTVYQVDGSSTVEHCELLAVPGFDDLAVVISKALNVGSLEFEHVGVIHKGFKCDMFVHDRGIIIGLERNEAATTIYRTNVLTKHPDINPEDLGYIAGPAVVFSRRVWF
jgi:hypothetical protein